MQLSFEHGQYVGPGRYPAAFHAPSDFCQLVYVNGSGTIEGRLTAPDYGDWTAREFGDPVALAVDKDVHYFKVLYIPGVDMYGVWFDEQRAEHRLGVFEWAKDVSPYLVSGSLEFSLGNPVTQLILELHNPNQEVAGEEDAALVVPGVGVQIFFRAGDSPRYPLGKYFVDRSVMGATRATTSIDATNMIGRLLQDQTFDESSDYPYGAFEQVLASMMDAAGVPEDSRLIYDSANSIGMRFPPEMRILDGVMAIIAAVSDGTLGGWQIRERMDGRIVLGPAEWQEHDQPGSYVFERGVDVWSRDVTRDDTESYSRVRVYTSTEQVYRTVEGRFALPAKKTLHVQAAEGTLLADLEAYADTLAQRLAEVGVVETFTGPFRPHLQPGDEATIVDGNSRLLGQITTVKLEFGAAGFSTEFVVDSGGRVGKAHVTDYIAKIAGNQTTHSSATRLYA